MLVKRSMKMHTKAEAQMFSVSEIQFKRNDLLKKHQTECNFSNNNNKNISIRNHNETNNEFVPSFTLKFNDSNEDIDFYIAKHFP